jgi:hypothetical protein
MVDATISRARLRDLACLGRSGLAQAGGAGSREACASPRRGLTDADRHRQALAAAPQTGRLTPGAGELMASPI